MYDVVDDRQKNAIPVLFQVSTFKSSFVFATNISRLHLSREMDKKKKRSAPNLQDSIQNMKKVYLTQPMKGLTLVSAGVLHDSDINAGRVQAGHRKLEGERLVKVWAVVLLDDFRLLDLHRLVLHHQGDLSVGVWRKKIFNRVSEGGRLTGHWDEKLPGQKGRMLKSWDRNKMYAGVKR